MEEGAKTNHQEDDATRNSCRDMTLGIIDSNPPHEGRDNSRMSVPDFVMV
jgi:hypothetical protein